MLTPWQGQGIRHPRYPAAPDAASPGTPGKQKEGCTNANDHPGAAVLEEGRSEEHTSELQSRPHLVCRLLLEKKKKKKKKDIREKKKKNKNAEKKVEEIEKD